MAFLSSRLGIGLIAGVLVLGTLTYARLKHSQAQIALMKRDQAIEAMESKERALRELQTETLRIERIATGREKELEAIHAETSRAEADTAQLADDGCLDRPHPADIARLLNGRQD